MSDPKIMQPNSRCPFCTKAFYISEKVDFMKQIQCIGCGSLFPVEESRLREEKKKSDEIKPVGTQRFRGKHI